MQLQPDRLELVALKLFEVGSVTNLVDVDEDAASSGHQLSEKSRNLIDERAEVMSKFLSSFSRSLVAAFFLVLTLSCVVWAEKKQVLCDRYK